MTSGCVVQVVGARPNFVKMAPVIAALEDRPEITQRVVHTGQHYDERLSAEMLSDLGFPEPDVFLGVGSGPHGAQTARVLEAFERLLLDERPDLVCVGGDVNSTLAAALAASKLGIPVAHVEAGLRSFDWTMPEEINRVLTDRMADLLFTHSPEAADEPGRRGHRRRAGAGSSGNTMIDSLRRFEGRAADAQPVAAGSTCSAASTCSSPCTARPTSTSPASCGASSRRSRRWPPPCPSSSPSIRARCERLRAEGLMSRLEAAGVRCLDPLGYLDFLGLEIGAAAIVTDSGGVQEEAAVLGVPCFTLRRNTERPVTITHGTNVLLGDDPAAIARIRPAALERRPAIIEGWDGRAGQRVADVLAAALRGEPMEAAA